MSHIGYLYEVVIHPSHRPNAPRPFGGCQRISNPGPGVWFGEVVADTLSHVDERPLRNADPTINTVAVAEHAVNLGIPDSIGISLITHEFGVQARMDLAVVGRPVQRRLTDSQQLRVAAALRLPRNGTNGRIVVHRGHGKSAQRAVFQAVKDAARQVGMVASIRPVVLDAELFAAVQAERFIAVRMVPIKKKGLFGSRSRGHNGASEPDDVKVEFGASAAKGFLRIPRELKQHILGNQRGAVVTFGGDDYEAVRVTVELEEGRQRTFTVGRMDKGVAFGYDLTPSGRTDDVGFRSVALAHALAGLLTET